MRYTSPAVRYLTSVALLVAPSLAQTYSNCNPLTRTDCPADSALGKTVNIDFNSASDSFTPQGNPTYDSNGVSFTVAKSGDSPQLTSKWYIMFGKVEVSIKAAPGAGMVSSFVLQSDDLDEIDWEWLGADPAQVQSNYFGKGQTTTYNRGAFHDDADSQTKFKTYTIDWTPQQVVWQIDGVTVRALSYNDANGQYPQTPMQIKIGAWAGGDPSNNAPGTVEWAKGPINYASGPYTMQVGSMKVTDYSSGTQYRYTDTTGTWQSIEAVGGKVNSGGSSEVEPNPPTVTSTTSGQPIPFDGTHSSDSSTYVRPSVYPWVPEATTLSTVSPTYANYPGLPSGWTVSDSGKVVPPSSAPSTPPPAASTPSPSFSPLPSAAAGVELSTGFDWRGFTTVYTITNTPQLAQTTAPAGFYGVSTAPVQQNQPVTTPKPTPIPFTGGADLISAPFLTLLTFIITTSLAFML